MHKSSNVNIVSDDNKSSNHCKFADKGQVKPGIGGGNAHNSDGEGIKIVFIDKMQAEKDCCHEQCRNVGGNQNDEPGKQNRRARTNHQLVKNRCKQQAHNQNRVIPEKVADVGARA